MATVPPQDGGPWRRPRTAPAPRAVVAVAQSRRRPAQSMGGENARWRLRRCARSQSHEEREFHAQQSAMAIARTGTSSTRRARRSARASRRRQPRSAREPREPRRAARQRNEDTQAPLDLPPPPQAKPFVVWSSSPSSDLRVRVATSKRSQASAITVRAPDGCADSAFSRPRSLPQQAARARLRTDPARARSPPVRRSRDPALRRLPAPGANSRNRPTCARGIRPARRRPQLDQVGAVHGQHVVEGRRNRRRAPGARAAPRGHSPGGAPRPRVRRSGGSPTW